MKEGQDKIYYITADNLNAAKNSPHLEIFRKKGIEVLLLVDRVDEWLVAHLHEFEGKALQSVAKGDIDIGKLEDKEEKEVKEKAEKEFETMLKQMKDTLGENVKEVRVTYRLTDSPACLVTDEQEMSIHLQRLMQAAGQAAFGGKTLYRKRPPSKGGMGKQFNTAKIFIADSVHSHVLQMVSKQPSFYTDINIGNSFLRVSSAFIIPFEISMIASSAS